jgi:hypothetical protein
VYTGAADDPEAVICARVESGKRCGEAGWLHRLRATPWRPARNVRSVAVRTAGPRLDLAALAVHCQSAVTLDRLDALARSLGLSVVALTALAVGWSAGHRAWAFPMRDAAGNVAGIRLRRPDGFKFAVTGGREGLFLPAGSDTAGGPLLVCEGPTDVAALWDMGFRNLVGRPSCTGGIKLLVELVRRRRSPELVIVADGDEPGLRGARNLASVMVAYVPAVRVVAPPEGVKDARDWLRAGGGRQDVQQAIQAAPVRRLTVRAATTGTKRGYANG